MASVKNLKKDIRYVTEVLISKAIMVEELLDTPSKKQAADAVIVEAAQMHNELIARVNHPDGKDNKSLVKKYYKSISNELAEKSRVMFLSLNDLIA